MNPLLWSHYADKHRGICLGFKVDERILRRVTYVRDRSPLKLPLTKETADLLLWTKYWDWRYEKEWRSWLQLDEREDGHYFYHLNSQPQLLRLCEVIVGPLCQATEVQVEAALGDQSDSVKIIKARLAFRTFRVVMKENGFERC